MPYRHRLVPGRGPLHAARVVPRKLAILLACKLAIVFSCLLAAPAMADDAAEVQKLLKAARTTEALSRVEVALAGKPRDAQLRFLKGVILAELNKPAEAIAIFTRLTEEYPQLPEPYNNLAVLYAAQGQVDKARAALEKALRTNPSYATAYENLGDIHAKLAAIAYDRALQMNSGSANARTSLSLVKNLGQTNSAPPRMADPAPAPRPQALPQVLPPSVPQALPPVAQAPQAAMPSKTVPTAPVAPPNAAPAQPSSPPKVANAPAANPAPAAPTQAPPSARAEAENTARAAAKQADSAREAVLATVHAWARDWSERDVKGYLSHYAPDFETPGKQSRKAWAEDRQARIVGKGRIQVKVEGPQVSVENGRATVKFRQQYSSDRLSVSSRKTLVLVQHKGRWLIQKESTGS